jgi:hypothetical protein
MLDDLLFSVVHGNPTDEEVPGTTLPGPVVGVGAIGATAGRPRAVALGRPATLNLAGRLSTSAGPGPHEGR